MIRKSIAVVLFVFLPVLSIAQEPNIVKDGRTWTWNSKLGMHTPEGPGWHYDIDQQIFWRYRKEVASQYTYVPQNSYQQYGSSYSFGDCANGQCGVSGPTRVGLLRRR